MTEKEIMIHIIKTGSCYEISCVGCPIGERDTSMRFDSCKDYAINKFHKQYGETELIELLL